MPDKLDAKKLEFFKILLTRMKGQILGDIKSMAKENDGDQSDKGDVSGHAMHMADVATDMYDREFSLGLASNDRELLYKVEGALKRIEDHSFGLCNECRKPITIARLKALPYVETCLKCQEKIESKR